MSTKNRISDNPIISISKYLLEENTLEIHIWLMLTTAIFAIAFSIVSVLLGDITQAWISVLGFLGVIIALLIQRKGLLYASKLFNAIQIIIVLAAICLFTGINSLAFMYYFPVLISILMAFQGKEKKTGFILSGFILLILVALTAISEPIGKNHFNNEHLFFDRTADIIGVALSCFLIIIFLLRTINKVKQLLNTNTSELIANNAQLLAAIYSRNQLMSVISHDLRAPLSGVIMTVEACLKEDTSEASKKEMLRILNVKAQQILTMIDQLLDWSRSQTGNLECKIETVAVEHFYSYTEDWTNLIGETKSILFIIDFTFEKDETISCDVNMIETALRNLISNAVKFSKIGSSIHIRSFSSNGKRTFQVEDFGIGITTSQLIKLKKGISFTTEGTNKEKGNGFGLQLVKEFLGRHHSHLEIHSEFGKGSLFSFKL